MLSFIMDHWWSLLTVYVIGAVVTFVATAIFVIRALKEENEEDRYEGLYEPEPGVAEKAVMFIVIFIAIALMAVLWIGAPIILGGVLLFDKISEKYPQLMGGMSDEDDKKEE